MPSRSGQTARERSATGRQRQLLKLCRPACVVLLTSAFVATAAEAGQAVRIAPFDEPLKWRAPMGRDHPLVGRIWDVRGGRFVSEPALLDHLVGVRFVITGESHNNPDHHQLQLRILKAMFGNGRRVSVGLEIFKTPDQAMLDQFEHGMPEQVDNAIEMLGLVRRHKALWDQYRPLLRFAVSAGLPLVAMDLSRREASAVVRAGTSALPKVLVERFRLDQPLPVRQHAILTRDLLQAHCGLLFTKNLDNLILAQRARDATMAERLEAADAGYGTLLLSGYGHARADRGVPYLLDERRGRGELVSVLFASVKGGLDSPADYRDWFGDDALPFDYVWFTPRVDDEDPCDRLRRIYREKPGAADPAASCVECVVSRSMP